MTPKQFFKTEQKLNRYLYTVELAQKLKSFMNKKYLIFDDNDGILKGNLFIREDFSDRPFDVISTKKKDTTFGLIWIEYYDDDSPWIPSKKEIKSIFKKFKVINPKDIKKII